MEVELNGSKSRYYQVAGEHHDLFLRKLMEHCGWSREFAVGAIQEYLKFIHIVKNCGAEQIPSKIVDEVWHMHLLFTKDYWESFCPRFVGFFLHHIPAPPSERHKSEEGYLRTLIHYESFFGPPPREYWPSLTVDQPSLIRSRSYQVFLSGLSVAGILSLTGVPTVTFLPEVSGPVFLMYYSLLLIMLNVVGSVVLYLGRDKSGYASTRLIGLVFAGWIVTVGIGALRAVHGYTHGYPIEFLVVLLVIFGGGLPWAVFSIAAGYARNTTWIGSSNNRHDGTSGTCTGTGCSSASCGGGCGGCSSS